MTSLSIRDLIDCTQGEVIKISRDEQELVVGGVSWFAVGRFVFFFVVDLL